ncbi:MAG: hypothetical protein Fur0023_03880 [Bacteroidia bacterium]
MTESAEKYFPEARDTFKSGSAALYKLPITEVKPFITEMMMTNAAVIKAIANKLIQLIKLMILLDFFENKYLLAKSQINRTLFLF